MALRQHAPRLSVRHEFCSTYDIADDDDDDELTWQCRSWRCLRWVVTLLPSVRVEQSSIIIELLHPKLRTTYITITFSIPNKPTLHHYQYAELTRPGRFTRKRRFLSPSKDSREGRTINIPNPDVNTNHTRPHPSWSTNSQTQSTTPTQTKTQERSATLLEIASFRRHFKRHCQRKSRGLYQTPFTTLERSRPFEDLGRNCTILEIAWKFEIHLVVLTNRPRSQLKFVIPELYLCLGIAVHFWSRLFFHPFFPPLYPTYRSTHFLCPNLPELSNKNFFQYSRTFFHIQGFFVGIAGLINANIEYTAVTHSPFLQYT